MTRSRLPANRSSATLPNRSGFGGNRMNRLVVAALAALFAFGLNGGDALARGHGGYHSSSRAYSPRSYSPRSYRPRSYIPRSYTPRYRTPRSYTPRYRTPRSYTPHYRVPRSYYNNGYQGGRGNGSRSPRAQWYSKYAPGGNSYSHHGRARSLEAKHEFWAMTGHPHGWPGHVVDHVIPLACGGADSPSNMQWQTLAEGKAKDKWERRSCSRHR